jgi:hypothetical protein
VYCEGEITVDRTRTVGSTNVIGRRWMMEDENKNKRKGGKKKGRETATKSELQKQGQLKIRSRTREITAPPHRTEGDSLRSVESRLLNIQSLGREWDR